MAVYAICSAINVLAVKEKIGAIDQFVSLRVQGVFQQKSGSVWHLASLASQN